jgi:hypothetical protein
MCTLYWLPLRLLLAVAVALVSSRASAGELGANSKASISISVTVPPALALREMRSANRSATAAPLWHFCVLAKGIETYSVTLLSPQYAPDEARNSSPAHPPVVITWSDGERSFPATQLKAGTTAVGFKSGTHDNCQRADIDAAQLKIGVAPSHQISELHTLLTLIIAVD